MENMCPPVVHCSRRHGIAGSQTAAVQYAVRSALLLLIRLPKAGRWRPQLQAAAEALTATFAGSQLLSSNQEEALKSYLHRAAREEV